jgi:DNA mismatch repair protein MutS
LPKPTTPMMAQYKSIKAQYKDALLFFRLGDFYEMFFEDAETGSRELGIALTGRDAGHGKRAPMCGVPYHAVDDYIKALITKGYKVAICEQTEDPSTAKGLVMRDVVRVITPGTYWEGAEATSYNYIAVIYPERGPRGQIDAVGLCSCDLSTGEILLGSFENDPVENERGQLQNNLVDELSRLLPKECVFPVGFEGTSLFESISKSLPGVFVSFLEDDMFRNVKYKEIVVSKWELDGISDAAHCAVLGLLAYIESTQMVKLNHLKKPSLYLHEAFLELDHSTRRNLELTQRLQGGSYGSLAWVLDKCCTSMGSRQLKKWIERPLREPHMIRKRLEAVNEIYGSSALRTNLRNLLSGIRDLERLVTKIAFKTCNARDLTAIASSLERVPLLKKEMATLSSELLKEILDNLDETPEVVQTVRKAIVDDPPISVTEGGIIRPGYSEDVDELRDLATGGKKWLMDLEARERERTGIKSLRIGYNRVFGYYIEVTRANLSLVPDDYIRKQTLVSAERFITPELKEKETSILGAEEKLCKEEYRLFSELRDMVESHIRRLQRTAYAIAQLDVLCSLAEVASLYGYTMPSVSDNGPIIIKEGRHPVLERVLPPGSFVPNDLLLDDKQRLLIITGPNMGGKSTYCRQTAIIVLMAQMGSFVPCKSCSISCVDKIFARVGAYDDLVLGQSTFMVEMNEVSRIVKSATPKSLVILDEIGRGTSTFDGLSVAWAVVEYLASDNRAGARGLVATHYRELTLLSDLKPGIANYHVTVKKSGHDIIFLRKVTKGVAEGSFGIDVAQMAGLPIEVVNRAREILSSLETEARKGSGSRKGILGHIASRSAGSLTTPVIPGQPLLFGFESQEPVEPIPEEYKQVISEIKSVDTDNMTPFQALEILYSLKSRIRVQEHDG